MRLTRSRPGTGRRVLRATALAALAGLTACGGGSSGPAVDPPASCSVADQKAWLRNYFQEAYFWWKLSPSPDPAGYTGPDTYFPALLYPGGDRIDGGPALWPRDRWSYSQSTESFNQFFGDGQTLGYGFAVAGLEIAGQPARPLYVRHVEPRSPAGLAGVSRGDRVLAVNGRMAADLVSANDFSALSPTAAGQTLVLQVRNAMGDRTVTLTAAVHALTPVPLSSVLTSPKGRKVGYVVVKDMISQALNPFDAALSDFKARGVNDVVLDLRYNGGGLVSVATGLAGYVGGPRTAGQVFARLLFNEKQTASDSTFRLANPPATASLELPRVFVLTGRRTCSASELVLNGLRGTGMEVVAVGETTCGKPFGFVPSSQCGTTYSVVNFETVNARNEGRYVDGLPANCAVAEDFTQPLGNAREPLLGAALARVDGGACPVSAAPVQPLQVRPPWPDGEPDARPVMMR